MKKTEVSKDMSIIQSIEINSIKSTMRSIAIDYIHKASINSKIRNNHYNPR